MGLKIGIVGLPNVGKSTLFKALTKNPVDINNYPFCTIEPNVGVVKVPDERLGKLAEISKSKRIVPTVIEFVDIAGLVAGASAGEGLGNKFLANIREVDAIAHVVRVFDNSQITHVSNSVDPVRDIEVIETELILADLETATKRAEKLQKEAKGNDKAAIAKLAAVEKIKKGLEEGKMAADVGSDLEDEIVRTAVQELALLTMKPVLSVYNVSDSDAKLPDALEKRPHVKLDIKIEEEMIDISEEEMKDLGMETGIHKLIVESYKLLDLITFLTSGEPETRAWTIRRGSTAPEAGAAIHTDFKDKFIRADVIGWEKFVEAGGWPKAREKGWVRTEGKEYVVQDGDVMLFKV